VVQQQPPPQVRPVQVALLPLLVLQQPLLPLLLVIPLRGKLLQHKLLPMLLLVGLLLLLPQMQELTPLPLPIRVM
jgi:hypothetical protein